MADQKRRWTNTSPDKSKVNLYVLTKLIALKVYGVRLCMMKRRKKRIFFLVLNFLIEVRKIIEVYSVRIKVKKKLFKKNQIKLFLSFKLAFDLQNSQNKTFLMISKEK